MSKFKHKKYIIFTYDRYYPMGGLNDIHTSVNTIIEARAVEQKELKMCSYVDIIDRDTWETVNDN